MIGGLKPYPAMKESGVPSLGDVPEHWAVRRIKTLFREKDERRRDGSGLLLSLTRARGLLPQSETSNRLAATEDLSKYKVCKPRDLIMNRMQAWSGMFAASRYDGLVSPDYSVFSAIEPIEVTYYEFLFRTPGVVDEFAKASKGIGTGFNRLYTPDFGAVAIVLPPHPEQVAIVRFLVHADRQIGRYIRSKEKLLKLLEEQKQGIIHSAVTRGLDPNVRLRPSGVEWLGDLPEHWAVSTIKRLARVGRKTFTDGDWIELPFITNSGVRLIQTGNVGPGAYREKGFRFVSEQTFVEFGCTEVRPNDVLICRLDGPVGRACLAPNLGVRAITSVDNAILKTRPDIDPRYVVYSLTSPIWLNWVQSLCRAGGGFRYRISRSALGDLRVAVPPYEEQVRVADALDSLLTDQARAQDLAKTEILRFREYRTRLIADVVTGKLDVREAAARLPDEVDDSEPLDERGSETDEEDLVENESDEVPEDAVA